MGCQEVLGMNRSRPAVTGLVILLSGLIIVLAGCSGARSGAQEAPRVVGWLTRAERTAEEVKPGAVLRRVKAADQAQAGRTQIDDLIRQAPRQPTAAEAAALQRLQALRAFYIAVNAAALKADAWQASLGPTLLALTDRTARIQLANRARVHLMEHGTSIARDAACDLVWSVMRAVERQMVRNELGPAGYQRVGADEVAGLESMTRNAAVDAIASNARTAFLKLFVRADVVDWVAYADGIYEKSDEFTEAAGDLISHPDGSMTRAMVYYGRQCLAPPR